jgi:hypothetical protein
MGKTGSTAADIKDSYVYAASVLVETIPTLAKAG